MLLYYRHFSYYSIVIMLFCFLGLCSICFTLHSKITNKLITGLFLFYHFIVSFIPTSSLSMRVCVWVSWWCEAVDWCCDFFFVFRGYHTYVNIVSFTIQLHKNTCFFLERNIHRFLNIMNSAVGWFPISFICNLAFHLKMYNIEFKIFWFYVYALYKN